MFLYFLHVIILLNRQIQSKIFTVPLTKMTNAYYLHCSIGEPFQRIYFSIDLENEYSFTNAFIYYKGKSEHYSFHSAKEISLEKLKIAVEEVSDLFELYKQDISIKNFHFFILPLNYQTYHSHLSFSYKNNDSNLNYIYQLYKNGHLDSYNFAISITKNEKEAKLLLGGIPSNIISNKYKSTCDVNGEYSSWGCTLNSVIYFNKTYTFDDYAMFSIEKEDIFSSYKFIEFLHAVVFKNYMLNSLCKYETNDSLYYYFYCGCEYVKTFADMKIVIGGNVFLFEGNKLFNRIMKHCFFKIKSYKDPEMNKHWIIGSSFIQNIVTQFDYDNHQVAFYTDYKLDYIAQNRNKPISKLYIIRFIYIICGCNIVGLVIAYFRNKKKNCITTLCLEEK